MRKNSVWRANLFTVFLVVLLTPCACGNDDNPLAPGKGAILMDYLPLDGNSLSYRFNMLYSSSHSETFYRHIIYGTCVITMEKALDYSFCHLLKTAAVFNIESDSTFFQKTMFDSEVSVRSNYTFLQSIDIIHTADSLWFEIDDTSSTEKGNRKLALTYSAELGGSLLDLTPFLPHGWEIKPIGNSPEMLSHNIAKLKADTLIYSFDIYNSVETYAGTVKLLKGIGLFSIEYSLTQGERTLSPRHTMIQYMKI